jgi:ion channel-forming bestrophin family protein
MIVPPKYGWLALIFRWRGTALSRMWKRLVFTTGVAVAITLLDHFHAITIGKGLTVIPFTLIGVALGVFLGFRNNTSYDRYWEGRKLWGSMVNTSRTATRQILTLIGPQPNGGSKPSEADLEEERAALVAFHREMVHRVAAYVHAVRLHLRDDKSRSDLSRLLPEAEIDRLALEGNRPIAILQTLGDRVRDAWMRGWVHPQHVPVLEQSLTQFCDIQGGCERIKNTPIPFSYTALIHTIVAIYTFLLPFGLIHDVKAFTPVVVAIIAFAFLGLDAVGDEIEDPFGVDPNDLPLTTLSTMIEINVRQRIGDTDLPEPRQPANRWLV